MTNKKSSVGILGAGISGLSIAYALAQKGIDTTVYEKEDEAGGAIRSVKINDWLVEEGPNTLMVKSPDIRTLLEQIGLGNQIMEANPAAQKRFVVKNGKLSPLPNSVGSFFKTPLLSMPAKVRLLKEPFVPSSTKEDESIAEFIERRLGKEVLDYGINPFVSGVYAGDPKELSIRHTFSSLWEMEQVHGSLFKGMFNRDRSNAAQKRSLISFKDGNQMLPKAMANSLEEPVYTSTEIQSVQKNNKHWVVKGMTHNKSFEHRHSCVVSTIPVYKIPEIFNDEHFEDLAKLPYAPLSVFALGFKKDQIGHPLDGFGMLIPETENYRLLGSLFSSTLFPGRAPENHHLLSCFIGGERNPTLAQKSKKELQSILLSELDELLNIKGGPVFTYHRYWGNAIPQYKVGYDHYLSLMKKIEKEFEGLFLDGNFRNGVSVPDCISSGFETAHKVHTFLKQAP